MMVFFEDMCLLNKDWTGFSAEEYREASESVMQEEQENNAEVMNRLNLSGYEVVRAQYFFYTAEPGNDDLQW